MKDWTQLDPTRPDPMINWTRSDPIGPKKIQDFKVHAALVLGRESGVRFRLHKSLDKQKVKSPKMTIFGQKFKVLTPPKIENLGVLGGKSGVRF